MEALERSFPRSEYAGADARADRRPRRTICIVQLQGRADCIDKSLAKDRTEKHIGMTCPDHASVQTDLLKHLKAILQRKDDTLLCRTVDVSLGVMIEV